MYKKLGSQILREVYELFKGYHFTDEKKTSILDALNLYLEGNEYVEIAARIGKSINTVKGYFAELRRYVPEKDMKLAKEVHIVNRFADKDNLTALVKDCYEKGLPISDIPDLLGRYYPDARMLYQQLENTESRVIREKCLKLKGIPYNFEDIAFFYIMGRNRLAFVKMFNVSPSFLTILQKNDLKITPLHAYKHFLNALDLENSNIF